MKTSSLEGLLSQKPPSYGGLLSSGAQHWCVKYVLMACFLGLSGCAHQIEKLDVPWWPQGPGDPIEDQPYRQPHSEGDKKAEKASSAVSNEPADAPPQNYTQATRFGDLLFISGQIAVDPATYNLVGEDAKTQLKAAMSNVQAVLAEHSMDLEDVVSVTLYLKHLRDLSSIDASYERFFTKLPARTVVEVADIPRGSLVQITVVAGR